MKTLIFPFLAAVFLALPVGAEEARIAQAGASADAAHNDAAMTNGEVRKVDKDAKKITIKHEPMPSLDMPAHTMVFQVSEPAMLDQVKAGDRIRFRAEKVGGAFRLTKIEPAK